MERFFRKKNGVQECKSAQEKKKSQKNQMRVLLVVMMMMLITPIESRRRKHSKLSKKKSVEATRIVGELTNLVSEIEAHIDEVFDDPESKNDVEAIKRKISQAWVIVKQLDEVGGELRVKAMPLMKALHNAAREVEAMSENENGHVGKVNAILEQQEQEQQQQLLKLIAMAEELMKQNEELNQYAVNEDGGEKNVEAPPHFLTALLSMKKHLTQEDDEEFEEFDALSMDDSSL